MLMAANGKKVFTMTRTKLCDRVLPCYTRAEEQMNILTHIAGSVMGIVALTLCVIRSTLQHNVWGIVASAIYGASMIAIEHLVQINMSGWMQGEYTLYIHADNQLVQQVVIKM